MDTVAGAGADPAVVPVVDEAMGVVTAAAAHPVGRSPVRVVAQVRASRPVGPRNSLAKAGCHDSNRVRASRSVRSAVLRHLMVQRRSSDSEAGALRDLLQFRE